LKKNIGCLLLSITFVASLNFLYSSETQSSQSTFSQKSDTSYSTNKNNLDLKITPLNSVIELPSKWEQFSDSKNYKRLNELNYLLQPIYPRVLYWKKLST
jgi:hypothetical protein